MMKNIVVCADGTGNAGGYTPDSNVYKTYNAVDIHHKERSQITFYDNGVGTSQNKIWRAISGGLGFGFKANVCDLYGFLARNYDPGEKKPLDGDPKGAEEHAGDTVYLFGFSRGAATIRALTGFIHACGLVDGRTLTTPKLKKKVQKAFKAYVRTGRKDTTKADSIRQRNHGRIPIKFVGVWDTVSALGFPQRTDVVGLVSFTLKWVLAALDYLSDRLFPHRFYNYDLTDNIEYAYHALAIDDARTSFWPLVWDERNREEGTVEQVWFAGMHSNVGGGYERAEMANVPLRWMLTRATHHGLLFKKGTVEAARADSDVNGRLYDSRDGLAIFYRYHPRAIEGLCKEKLNQKIKIHKSVIGRMQRKTANYAPTHLPGTFTVVSTSIGQPMIALNPQSQTGWDDKRKEVRKNILKRQLLYIVMLIASLIILVIAISLWNHPPQRWGSSGFFGYVADVLTYIFPGLFSGLIEVAVRQAPLYYFLSPIVLALSIWWYRQSCDKRIIEAAVELREMVVRSFSQKQNI